MEFSVLNFLLFLLELFDLEMITQMRGATFSWFSGTMYSSP